MGTGGGGLPDRLVGAFQSCVRRNHNNRPTSIDQTKRAFQCQTDVMGRFFWFQMILLLHCFMNADISETLISQFGVSLFWFIFSQLKCLIKDFSSQKSMWVVGILSHCLSEDAFDSLSSWVRTSLDFIHFLSYFGFGCSWLTNIWWQFQVKNQTFISLHSSPDSPPIQAARQLWAGVPVLYSRSLSAIHFQHSSRTSLGFKISDSNFPSLSSFNVLSLSFGIYCNRHTGD